MAKKLWALHVNKNGVQHVYFFSSRNRMKTVVRRSAGAVTACINKKDIPEIVERLDVKHDSDTIYVADYSAYDGAELISSISFKGKLYAIDEQVTV